MFGQHRHPSGLVLATWAVVHSEKEKENKIMKNRLLYQDYEVKKEMECPTIGPHKDGTESLVTMVLQDGVLYEYELRSTFNIFLNLFKQV